MQRFAFLQPGLLYKETTISPDLKVCLGCCYCRPDYFEARNTVYEEIQPLRKDIVLAIHFHFVTKLFI